LNRCPDKDAIIPSTGLENFSFIVFLTQMGFSNPIVLATFFSCLSAGEPVCFICAVCIAITLLQELQLVLCLLHLP
jgi:hypothetical protein